MHARKVLICNRQPFPNMHSFHLFISPFPAFWEMGQLDGSWKRGFKTLSNFFILALIQYDTLGHISICWALENMSGRSLENIMVSGEFSSPWSSSIFNITCVMPSQLCQLCCDKKNHIFTLEMLYHASREKCQRSWLRLPLRAHLLPTRFLLKKRNPGR